MNDFYTTKSSDIGELKNWPATFDILMQSNQKENVHFILRGFDDQTLLSTSAGAKKLKQDEDVVSYDVISTHINGIFLANIYSHSKKKSAEDKYAGEAGTTSCFFSFLFSLAKHANNDVSWQMIATVMKEVDIILGLHSSATANVSGESLRLQFKNKFKPRLPCTPVECFEIESVEEVLKTNSKLATALQSGLHQCVSYTADSGGTCCIYGGSVEDITRALEKAEWAYGECIDHLDYTPADKFSKQMDVLILFLGTHSLAPWQHVLPLVNIVAEQSGKAAIGTERELRNRLSKLKKLWEKYQAKMDSGGSTDLTLARTLEQALHSTVLNPPTKKNVTPLRPTSVVHIAEEEDVSSDSGDVGHALFHCEKDMLHSDTSRSDTLAPPPESPKQKLDSTPFATPQKPQTPGANYGASWTGGSAVENVVSVFDHREPHPVHDSSPCEPFHKSYTEVRREKAEQFATQWDLEKAEKREQIKGLEEFREAGSPARVPSSVGATAPIGFATPVHSHSGGVFGDPSDRTASDILRSVLKAVEVAPATPPRDTLLLGGALARQNASFSPPTPAEKLLRSALKSALKKPRVVHADFVTNITSGASVTISEEDNQVQEFDKYDHSVVEIEAGDFNKAEVAVVDRMNMLRESANAIVEEETPEDEDLIRFDARKMDYLAVSTKITETFRLLEDDQAALTDLKYVQLSCKQVCLLVESAKLEVWRTSGTLVTEGQLMQLQEIIENMEEERGETGERIALWMNKLVGAMDAFFNMLSIGDLNKDLLIHVDNNTSIDESIDRLVKQKEAAAARKEQEELEEAGGFAISTPAQYNNSCAAETSDNLADRFPVVDSSEVVMGFQKASPVVSSPLGVPLELLHTSTEVGTSCAQLDNRSAGGEGMREDAAAGRGGTGGNIVEEGGPTEDN